MPKRGSNYEQNHYAAAIVKRTAGCTENHGSWPQANRQHVYFFSEMHGNIERPLTKARRYSSYSPQGRLEVPCTLCFS